LLPTDYDSWSREGDFICFNVPTTNEPAIYRIRASDQKGGRVASLEGFPRMGDPLGPWMGLAPDDSSFVPCDPGVDGIYALNVDLP
jgi:hypothetical protein